MQPHFQQGSAIPKMIVKKQGLFTPNTIFLKCLFLKIPGTSNRSVARINEVEIKVEIEVEDAVEDKVPPQLQMIHKALAMFGW